MYLHLSLAQVGFLYRLLDSVSDYDAVQIRSDIMSDVRRYFDNLASENESAAQELFDLWLDEWERRG